MNDYAVRVMLDSAHQRILDSYRLNAEGRYVLTKAQQSIQRSLAAIHTTDLLIATLSEALAGFADG